MQIIPETIGAKEPDVIAHGKIQDTSESTIHSPGVTVTTNVCKANTCLNIPPIVTCDYGYIRKDSTIVAILGGDSGTQGDTSKDGFFICHLVYPFAQGVWYVGAI